MPSRPSLRRTTSGGSVAASRMNGSRPRSSPLSTDRARQLSLTPRVGLCSYFVLYCRRGGSAWVMGARREVIEDLRRQINRLHGGSRARKSLPFGIAPIDRHLPARGLGVRRPARGDRAWPSRGVCRDRHVIHSWHSLPPERACPVVSHAPGLVLSRAPVGGASSESRDLCGDQSRWRDPAPD
jgi:hypothetical protein